MSNFLYDPNAYEIQAVAAITASDDDIVESFHWPNVPEKTLLDSGYIVDMAEHRTERLRNGGFRDYGLDGIARMRDDSYIGIQAKAYGPRSTITADCLGTFQLAITFLRERNRASRGVLVHTPEAKVENRLRIAIDRGMGNVTRTILPFSGSEPGPPEVKPGQPIEPDFELRGYQERAVAVILESRVKLGLYVSPCGTGKTLVVGTVLRTKAPDIVVVASPLQVSAEQNAARIGAFLPDHTLVRAWSEAGVTAAEVVRNAIEAAGPRVFVSTTFDTLPVVATVFSDSNFYLVVDEAHNLPPLETQTTSSSSDSDTDEDSPASVSANNHPLWTAVYSAERALLVTATPPARLIEDNPDVASVHTYTFGEAIADGAISDYRIYIPEIAPVSCESVGDKRRRSPETEPPENSVAAKAAFLASGMLESGTRRCIVFCESVAACTAFAGAFKETCEGYFGVGCATQTVTCNTVRSARAAALRDFSEGPVFETRAVASEWTGEEYEERKTILRIIAAVRILDEAVDVPSCDSVFFTRVSKASSQSAMAPARAVQRLCRAMRVHPSKTHAAAFVWTLDGDDEGGLVEMFSLLKENDVRFAEKTVAVCRNYDAKGERESVENAEITIRDFNERFVARAVTVEGRWTLRLEETKAFVVEHGRLPKHTDKPLWAWISHQRWYYKNGTLSDDRAAALEAVPGWWWEKEDPFPPTLEKLKVFLREHGRLPKTIEKPLGRWISDKRTKYKEGKLEANRVAALEDIPGWKWEEEDPFPGKLEKLKDFVAEHGRLPKHIDKPLGQWINTQRGYYKNGTLSDDRIASLEAVTGWKWEEEDPFPATLENLKAFVAKHGRLPKHTDKPLCAWINVQRKNYKEKKLSENRIKELEAVAGWKWKGGGRFLATLAELKAFVAENDRLPKRSDKPLGNWLNSQRQNYKKRKLSKDRIKALEAVRGWRWRER